jgi:hypothetical protein
MISHPKAIHLPGMAAWNGNKHYCRTRTREINLHQIAPVFSADRLSEAGPDANQAYSRAPRTLDAPRPPGRPTGLELM